MFTSAVSFLSRGLLAVLLTLLFGGCAGGPRRSTARPPDWESEEFAGRAIHAPAEAVSSPTNRQNIDSSSSLPASPTNNTFTETWISLNQWCRANGLSAATRLGNRPLPACALKTSNGVLVLQGGSQAAYWDGAEVRLGFAPQFIEGLPYVHSLDLKKTVQPLVGLSGRGLKTNPIIVIDPGHGGENPGTKSVLTRRYEKEFTLDWAQRLGRVLAGNGWQVLLTRTNDSDLALSNRVAFAEEHKADLFLSLHFNSSAPDESQAGLETYCLTPVGMPSTVTRGFNDNLGVAFPNNDFDEQNLQFALRVHRQLLQVNGNHDRGVRRARFLGVLRGQQRPAILIEGGYLSNPGEARQISDPAYRQKLAEAVARALQGHEGGARDLGPGEQRSELVDPKLRVP